MPHALRLRLNTQTVIWRGSRGSLAFGRSSLGQGSLGRVLLGQGSLGRVSTRQGSLRHAGMAGSQKQSSGKTQRKTPGKNLLEWKSFAPAVLDNYMIRSLLGKHFLHCRWANGLWDWTIIATRPTDNEIMRHAYYPLAYTCFQPVEISERSERTSSRLPLWPWPPLIMCSS